MDVSDICVRIEKWNTGIIRPCAGSELRLIGESTSVQTSSFRRINLQVKRLSGEFNFISPLPHPSERTKATQNERTFRPLVFARRHDDLLVGCTCARCPTAAADSTG